MCSLPSPPLRYLLKFGKVSQYVGYNALSDYFPSMELRPNPQCSNSHCRLQQERHQEYLRTHPPDSQGEGPGEDEEDVVHESNEWGTLILCALLECQT